MRLLLYLGMRHKVKTGIFKTLDLLPPAWGFGLYHYPQRFSENSNLEHKVNSTQKTFEELERICQSLDISLENKQVIEIGSGWLPLIPYFLRYRALSGAVHTYDRNAHYQKQSIRALNGIFSDRYARAVTPARDNHYALPEGVHFHPKQNLIHAALPQAKIVLSRFVLEHVRPEDIRAMHEQFKSLGKDVNIIHFISPSAHRAYSDSSLSLPQYLKIFTDLGYQVLYESHSASKPGTPQYDQFKKLKLHPDFAAMTDEELTAGSINVVLKL